MREQGSLSQKTRENMNDKANKFLERGCINEVGWNTWSCRPILGYNIHTYTIKRHTDGMYYCNCQGFRKNGYCSHIEAVRIFIVRNSPVTGEGQETFAFATP
jgi:hypothetical protein